MTGDPRMEERLESEERELRRNRLVAALALGLGVALVFAVAALVASIVALNRDVEAVAGAAPKPGSVGAEALQADAVTADALAEGAVGTDALAPEAVTASKLAPGAIGVVPQAESARQADNAAALQRLPAAAFLSAVELVQETSASDTQPSKGPVTARCPSGTRIVAGGAAVDGVSSGVAIVRSSPQDADALVGQAEAFGAPAGPWRLVVTAVCAAGGG